LQAPERTDALQAGVIAQLAEAQQARADATARKAAATRVNFFTLASMRT
jgi:alpha-D-ribose 1-methylphosphonate 5-triphosphate synthase subunit PhnG